MTATTRAAVAFATTSRPLVAASVLELAKQEIRMTLAKKVLNLGIGAAIVCCVLALGLRSSAEPPSVAPPPQPGPAAKEPAKKLPQAVVSKTFAVAPITTELQRRLYRGAGPNSAAVVIVDGAALFKDPNTLNTDALNLKELQTALESLRPEKGRSVAHIEMHYGRDRTSGNCIDWLDSALIGTLVSAGFVPSDPTHRTIWHNSAFSFEDYVAPLKDNKGADDAENGVGDERVQAYPVRTPLSRALTQSVGGVVEVYPRLVCKTDDWVPENVDKSVAAAIEKLKLAKGQRVNFSLNIHGERDSQTRGRVRNACSRWVENAGLELGQLSY